MLDIPMQDDPILQVMCDHIKKELADYDVKVQLAHYVVEVWEDKPYNAVLAGVGHITDSLSLVLYTPLSTSLPIRYNIVDPNSLTDLISDLRAYLIRHKKKIKRRYESDYVGFRSL